MAPLHYAAKSDPFLSSDCSKGIKFCHLATLVRRQLDALVEEIVANRESTFGDVDGGLYVGPAGVAYALWYVAKSGTCRDPRSLMTTAHDIIK